MDPKTELEQIEQEIEEQKAISKILIEEGKSLNKALTEELKQTKTVIKDTEKIKPRSKAKDTEKTVDQLFKVSKEDAIKELGDDHVAIGKDVASIKPSEPQ